LRWPWVYTCIYRQFFSKDIYCINRAHDYLHYAFCLSA
jgi:hypothetical protein